MQLTNAIPAVKAGMPVNVILKAGNASVEVAGVVVLAGKASDMVTVEVTVGSPPIKTTHVGKLTAPGVVEVRL